MCRTRRILFAVLAGVFLLSGCTQSGGGRTASGKEYFSGEDDLPEIPEKLEIGAEGLPVLGVYDIRSETVETIDIEEYLLGVVAGEMKNDWPMEALRAQAILARTFVLKFCSDKESRYPGADISTDVAEAQAYAPENINDRVRQAVADTAGEVVCDDGELIHAWFFAHSGGRTELPSVSLDYTGEDPDYLDSVVSPDSGLAPDDVKNWSVRFTEEQVLSALREAGTEISHIESVKIGKRGESGRAATLIFNDIPVSAPTFRIAIGANSMKSTLIDSLDWDGETLILRGRGFGHGVGLSQWGAYELAERGMSAEEIIRYYFDDVDIAKLW